MTASQNTEMLIAELTALYSKNFEKIIKNIFNNDWTLDTFTDEFFIIKNINCYPIKVDFDENGYLQIDPFDIFGYSPISTSPFSASLTLSASSLYVTPYHVAVVFNTSTVAYFSFIVSKPPNFLQIIFVNFNLC